MTGVQTCALPISAGAAVLTLRSLSVDAQGRPVESFVAYHRGDRSRFEVDLVREANAHPVRPSMIVTGGEEQPPDGLNAS